MQVRKRDGSLQDFSPDRIANAISKAFASLPYKVADQDDQIRRATNKAVKQLKAFENTIVSIELIQDQVERALMEVHPDSAKQYILYRESRKKTRETRPANFGVEEMKLQQELFSTDLELFQHLNKYSKYREDLGRREMWHETVDRAIHFMQQHLSEYMNKSLPEHTWEFLREALLHRRALPSMRLLQMAGPAAMRENMAVFNCSYSTLRELKDFADHLYILMQGAGASFTVEYCFVEDLPKVRTQRKSSHETKKFVIEDSTEGWCDALLFGITNWYDGHDCEFDFSKIRPEGSILKTKGGKASGPGPLRDLLDFTRRIILSRQGRRLRPIDVHDIACKIGKIVEVGGVRRAAELSLSNLDDMEMRLAKSGEFWHKNDARTMANNSAVYLEKPTSVEFMEEWLNLAKSGTGERGIFNREGAIKNMPKRRIQRLSEAFSKFKAVLWAIGTNPCGEIWLIPKSCCNLSIAPIQPSDSFEEIKEKVRIAAIFGTIQSTMTNFKYIHSDWKKNAELERLLGVDIPGASDHYLFSYENPDQAENLRILRETVIQANEEFAEILGIAPSVACTCNKPGGNSSVFLHVGHAVLGWYAEHMIRRVIVNSVDPMAKFLIDQGVPHSPNYDEPDPKNPKKYIFSFPQKAPENAYIGRDKPALEVLENWKRFKINWTEHNPSISVYVAEDEWFEVGNWVYENWDYVGGLSFFPKDDHVYALAPIEPLTKEQYDAFVKSFPKIDWTKFPAYDLEDHTTISQEVACTSGQCDISF